MPAVPFAVKGGAVAKPEESVFTTAIPPVPSALVTTPTDAPPAPVATICGTLVRPNDPAKATVYTLLDAVTATDPPTPPMLLNAFKAFWTAIAVALNASELVVWPLNVSVNVPAPPETVTFWTSVPANTPPSVLVATEATAPPLPAAVIWLASVRRKLPPKVTIKSEPERYTVTDPPTPPMVGRVLSAFCT
ncbi:MAG: hypothetical protein DMF06_06240 [Verrucomicrobia bacterium]|nr:MAG: hypothetical protein DMF06_06240 [Verrucomicrobiota bacterium]